MRHAILAALTLLMALTPVHAQDAPVERTLVDAVLFVSPPDSPGLCMPLGAGQITITTQRVAEAIELRPTTFRIDGYQDDPGTHLTVAISRQETTLTTHVSGSYHYCWRVDVDAPETERMPNAQRGAYVQTVAVKIVHRPD